MHEFSFEETADLLSAIDGYWPCSDSVNELKSAFLSIIAPTESAAVAIREMGVKLDAYDWKEVCRDKSQQGRDF